MTMREKLDRANACNPKMRSIAGFQTPFKTNLESLEIIVQNSLAAEVFDLVYENDSIEVYRMLDQLESGPVKSFDVKYIAQHKTLDRYLVCQGLIIVHDVANVAVQEKRAKKMLIDAIQREWHILLKKASPRDSVEVPSPLRKLRTSRWVIRPPPLTGFVKSVIIQTERYIERMLSNMTNEEMILQTLKEMQGEMKEMQSEMKEMHKRFDRLEEEMNERFDRVEKSISTCFNENIAISKDIFDDLQLVKKKIGVHDLDINLIKKLLA